MNITKEQKKEKAIELLKKLNIYKPYIDGFRKDDQVCFFERYGGYWAYQDPELQKKMTELEKEYACTVYAITHEFAEFGECYSFLLVTDYKEEWTRLIQSPRQQTLCVRVCVEQRRRQLFGIRYDRRTELRRRDCEIRLKEGKEK